MPTRLALEGETLRRLIGRVNIPSRDMVEREVGVARASSKGEPLRDLRARDVIGDAAFQALEEELDVRELTADSRVRSV